MKTIITAALLVASSAVQAEWDMPFFGNGSNANNGAFIGNGAGDTAGNGAHKGNGSAEGEGEFSFAMSFKGRGTGSAASDSSSVWNSKTNGDFKADSQTVSNSKAESVNNYAPFGYNPYTAANTQAAAPVTTAPATK